jgi:hypothetical protein
MEAHGESGVTSCIYWVLPAYLLVTDALCTKYLLRKEDNKSLVFALFFFSGYEGDYSFCPQAIKDMTQ